MQTDSFLDNSANQIRAAEARQWAPDPAIEQAEADYIRAIKAHLTAQRYYEDCAESHLTRALAILEGARETVELALDALHDVASPSDADIRALRERAHDEWLAGRKAVRGEA